MKDANAGPTLTASFCPIGAHAPLGAALHPGTFVHTQLPEEYMPRISLALLLCAVFTGVRLAAGDAPSPAPAPATATLPEQTVLAWAKTLQSDDYKAVLAMLPTEAQARAVASWKSADSTQDKDIDAKLAQLLAPNAVDGFMADLSPKLATMDPANMAQSLVSVAGVLPLMLQSSQPAAAPSADQTAILTAAQNLLSDIAAWLPTSGITDPANLKKALTLLVDAVKASGITSAADMHKMTLEDCLGKVGPAIKKVKAALLVYGLDANHLLASVTATGAAGADATHRSLTIGFTAFGRVDTFNLPLVQANGAWTVPTDAIPGYNNLKNMVPALGGGTSAPSGAAPGGDNEGRKFDGAPAPAPAPAGQGK